MGRLEKLALAGFLVIAAVVFVVGSLPHSTAKVAKRATKPELTIYLRNFDPQHISDSTIRNDIPAWEAAANGRFRAVWGTPKVRLVLTRKVPAGALEADFTNTGPVQGALAYHTQHKGRSAIVVYVGADDYFGFSDSVSFTHELFETLADRTTANINQGWPFPFITFDHGQFAEPSIMLTPQGQLLINEVCDPVEAFHYMLPGLDGKPVQISDWVTQNYFNDEQTVPAGVPEYDAMGLVQQPLTLLAGGYQSLYVIDYILPNGNSINGWVSVTNFRHAPTRDPGGFMDDTDGRVLAR